MATCDIEQLVADGRCFGCLEPKQMQAVLLQLVCELQAQIAVLVAAIPAQDTGPTSEDLVYGTPLTLDFDGADYQTIALTGNINFSASANRPALGLAKVIRVVIQADGTDRTLSFNAGWICIGATPAGILASANGLLTVMALGPDETDVVFVYDEVEAGPTTDTLGYATPLTLDFDGADYQTVALTGVISFSASANRPAAGFAKAIAVRIQADGSARALSFHASWICIGAVPTQIAANKTGILSLTAFGGAEADVVYAYQEQV
jgi:hypothetical protein